MVQDRSDELSAAAAALSRLSPDERRRLLEEAPLSRLPEPILLTAEQAAARLGVSDRLLRDHVRQGHIAYVQLGAGLKRPRRMFHPDDIAAFIDRQRRTDRPISVGTRRHRSKTASGTFGIVDFGALRRESEGQNTAKFGVPRKPRRG